MDVSQRGEFGLIAHLHRQLKTRAGTRTGIGDDAAVLEALAHPIVTVDALVEGVHFRRDWTSARALGAKSMAVNLSDLAAMGARPIAAFVALAVPRDCSSEWISELYIGMETLAARHDFTIAGGDMTAAPGVFISVTLVGDLMLEAAGRPVTRSGARVGDAVCVTGDLGDSAAGLSLLQNADAPGGSPGDSGLDGPARAYLLGRHLEPAPRLERMRELLARDRDAVHAALDLSDGLAGDARHIARASGVDIEIYAEQLPISAACARAARALNQSATNWALSGGEDYELCLCLAPEGVAPEFARGLHQVGRVVACNGAGEGATEGAGEGATEGAGEGATEGAGESQVRVFQDGKLRQNAAGWTHF